MRTFSVVINDNSIYTHNVVVLARCQDEALDQALDVVGVPYENVVSAVVTPRVEERPCQGKPVPGPREAGGEA